MCTYESINRKHLAYQCQWVDLKVMVVTGAAHVKCLLWKLPDI